MMAQNAATSLIDILESYSDFECEAAFKDVKNIQQYYDEKKVLSIVGRTATGFPVDPKKVLTTEVDVSIAQSKKSPTHRSKANDFFINLFNSKAIEVEDLLESVNDIPGAEELLQKLRSRREQMEQGGGAGAGQPVPPELVQQVQQGLNPNPQSMQLLNRMIGRG
jgi:hypothetical protein